jgi:hypothetical protein
MTNSDSLSFSFLLIYLFFNLNLFFLRLLFLFCYWKTAGKIYFGCGWSRFRRSRILNTPVDVPRPYSIGCFRHFAAIVFNKWKWNSDKGFASSKEPNVKEDKISFYLWLRSKQRRPRCSGYCWKGYIRTNDGVEYQKEKIIATEKYEEPDCGPYGWFRLLSSIACMTSDD